MGPVHAKFQRSPVEFPPTIMFSSSAIGFTGQIATGGRYVARFARK